MCRPLTQSEGSMVHGYQDQPTGYRSAPVAETSGHMQKEKTMIFHINRRWMLEADATVISVDDGDGDA
jgi:hypothetical protein